MRGLFVSVFAIVALAAPPAVALSRQILWQHPWSEALVDTETVVTVVVDGSTYDTVPVTAEDYDPETDTFATTVVVPYGADVQIGIVTGEGASPLSNALVFGDKCSDLDLNGDGVVGGPDWTLFRAEYKDGTAFASEVEIFRSWFLQQC